MKVYISHSRRDAIAASKVAAAIERAGHEALVDRDELLPGANFDSAIEKMIDEADIVLVVWSPASVGSDYILAEAERALGLGKYLGFMIGAVDLPVQFRVLQHHSLERDGGESRPGMIAEALQGAGRRPAQARAASRAARTTKGRPPPPRAPSPAAPAPSASEPEPELEIPAFLRRQSQTAPDAPVADASPAASFSGPAPAAEPPAPAGERGYDVFISYSRKDLPACELAFNLMAESGLVPWYDKDIGGGAFKQKIVTRISKAAVFVLLLSRNSVGSPNVSKELSVAAGEGRLIIPISIDGIGPGELTDTFRYELTELNIFAANPAQPETWSDVIRTVAESVAERRAGEAAGPAQPIQRLAGPAHARPRRPVLFAGLSVVSGVLQQAALGFALWRSGLAGPELAAALAIAAGAIVWPLTYAAALLARLAFRRSGG